VRSNAKYEHNRPNRIEPNWDEAYATSFRNCVVRCLGSGWGWHLDRYWNKILPFTGPPAIEQTANTSGGVGVPYLGRGGRQARDHCEADVLRARLRRVALVPRADAGFSPSGWVADALHPR
jgi:hypothetical protein